MADTPWSSFTDQSYVAPGNNFLAETAAGSGAGVNIPGSAFIARRSDTHYSMDPNKLLRAGTQPLLSGDGAANTYLYAGTSGFTVRNAADNRSELFVDANGNLLVGTTSLQTVTERFSVAASASGSAATFRNSSASEYTARIVSTAAAGNNAFVGFYTEPLAGITNRGGITYNRASGMVVYSTTSDYRAKDDLGPLDPAAVGATIDLLRPILGKMHGATLARPMFVAHEVAEAGAPYAVTGEKDAVDGDGNPIHQQLDVSALVPLLVAEIKALRQRVAALESGAGAQNG